MYIEAIDWLVFWYLTFSDVQNPLISNSYSSQALLSSSPRDILIM
jgi:hypothetical protein